MSTEFIVLGPDGRDARFCGDYDRVFRLIVRAPAAELAGMAALLPSDAVRFEPQRRGALDKIIPLNEALHTAPQLEVRPDGWMPLRQILLESWQIDLADAPVAISTGYKYGLEVTSPAQSVLRELIRRADGDPILAKARSQDAYMEERLPDGRKRRWPYPYFNEAFDRVDTLISGLSEQLRTAMRRQPGKWQERRWRTAHLFEQLNAYPHVEPPFVSPPGDDWYRHSLRRANLLPGRDTAMAAWPDHRINLTFGPLNVPFSGKLGELLRVAREIDAERRRRLDSRDYDWVGRGAAEYAREQAALEGLTSAREILARAFAIEPRHGIGWALAVSLTREHGSMRTGLPGRWALHLHVSQTLSVPQNADYERLRALPWSFNAVDGAEATPIDLVALLGWDQVRFRHGTIRLRSTLRGRSDRQLVLEPTEVVWEPKQLALDTQTAQRATELALANAQMQLEHRLETGSEGYGKPAFGAERRAELEAELAWWQALRVVETHWCFEEESQSFHYGAELAPAQGNTILLSFDVPVETPDGDSPIEAAAEVQQRFVNNSGDKIRAAIRSGSADED